MSDRPASDAALSTGRVVVTFDETGEEREVVAYCRRCNVTPDDRAFLVSPSGMAHHGIDDHTVCGFDATGDAWWWPL